MRTTGALLLLCTACASPSGGAKREQGTSEGAEAGAPSEAGAPVATATPEPGERLAGRWRMIAEDPVAGQPGITKQARKLLELRADGTFASENYIERLEGAWKLDGETLALGERAAQLVDVSADRLVLIEDVPEIYLRDGPPQKVRMTYRRVSESELGRMVGRPPELSVPTPGRFEAAYAYRMTKYPTMEIYVGRSVDGRARIALAADGTASGCFGVSTGEHASTSKYASQDGEHHSRRSERQTLIGWTGNWVAGPDAATVTADRTWRDACEDPGPDAVPMGRLELECQALAANEAVPVDALACRIVEGPSALEDIAINPADTERSGPYTMQSDPMGHISTDLGRPWLIVGAAPGLKVDSDDGRDVSTPVVKFAAEKVDWVEGNYRPRPSAD